MPGVSNSSNCPRIWRAILAFLIVFVAFSTLRLRSADPPLRFNLVFIVADDLRPDAPGFAGNTLVRTPHLDQLASRGAVFTRATCGYPICHVSRSEMFSGRVLLGAGRDAMKFDPEWTLWPERMKRAGWHTVYSGKWHAAGTPAGAGFIETAGLYRGDGAGAAALTIPITPTGRTVTGYMGWTFRTDKNEPQAELGVGLTPETDGIITDRALEALRRIAGKPFFLQISYTAPHDPLHWPPGAKLDYRDVPLPRNFRPAHPFDTGNIAGRDERIVPAPRSEDDVRKERAIYFRQVENIDRQIGRIVESLSELRLLETTLIVFTSDHGLALGSHGLMGKQNQYEHTINVPLVMAGPHIATGKRFAAQCHLRDLYPTICELAGVEIPSSVQGRSLAPVLRDEKTEIHDAIFGHFTDTQRMMRTTDGWKLFWYPRIARYQLFNVTDDPHELEDRIAEPELRSRLMRMKAALAEWQRAHNDSLLAPRS